MDAGRRQSQKQDPDLSAPDTRSIPRAAHRQEPPLASNGGTAIPQVRICAAIQMLSRQASETINGELTVAPCEPGQRLP